MDGGVYDNHGMEPIVKRYMTLFVGDGGAPFARTSDMNTDALHQLARVLAITDNQSRALRRRDLVSRLIKGDAAFTSGALGASSIYDVARMGAYWGIDTDPSSAEPPNALPCNRALVEDLATTSTQLANPATCVPSSWSIGATPSATAVCAPIIAGRSKRRVRIRSGLIERLRSA